MDHCFRFSNNQGAQYWALTGEILVNKTSELNLLMVWSLRNGTRLDIYIINIDMYGYSSICHSDVITEFQLSLFWVNSAFENSMRQSWTNTATCYKIYSLSLQAFYRCTPTFCAASFVVLCSPHFFQFWVSVVILMRIFGLRPLPNLFHVYASFYMIVCVVVKLQTWIAKCTCIRYTHQWWFISSYTMYISQKLHSVGLLLTSYTSFKYTGI